MAKDLSKIKKELTDQSTVSKYRDKKHDEIAEILRTSPGKVPRETIETGLLRATVVPADYAKLKPDEAAYWNMMIGGESLPLTATAKAGLLAVFPPGSATATAIAAMMFRDTTLAEELGVPGINASDVADALREKLL